MPKIAVISEHLTPQVLGLAQALHFQRHEVMIITSHGEEVPDNVPFQVLKFFKTWSAFEAIRFFPRLLGHAPDVWHFVFSIKDSKKKPASHRPICLGSLGESSAKKGFSSELLREPLSHPCTESRSADEDG